MSDDPPGAALDVGRERFVDMAAGDRPVVVRASACLDASVTPLAAYAALSGRTTDADPADYAFLLESAEKTPSSDPDGAFRPSGAGGDRHARYSFVGADPAAVVTVDPDGTEVETLDPRYEEAIDPVGAGGSGNAGSEGDGDPEGEDHPDPEGGTDPESAGGSDPDPDTVDVLRSVLPDARLENFPDRERQQLEGGLVGFLAYDAVYDLWLHEVGLERPASRFPDAQFVLTDATLVFDHREGSVDLVLTPLVRPEEDAGAVYDEVAEEVGRIRDLLASAADPDPGRFARAGEAAGSREAYEDAVERAKEHVLDGDVYQGVISRTRELYGEVDPLGLYAALRDVNPSPYMYLLDHDGLSVVGASPETLVSVRDGTVVSNPIAGTCRRGPSPVEDRRLAGEMLADEKERAEHTMLVDLARNDVRRVSEPGSVRVEEFMSVLKYSHVQHIESTVTGRLADDADAYDATRAAFPAGTLAGAPKIRAMEIIDDLETTPRGVYGGGVGYYAWTGEADFCIVIRTATVEDGEGPYTADREDDRDRITVRAGAGIVADSDPAAEFAETEQKMDGVLAAVDRIEHDAEPDADPEADPEGEGDPDGDSPPEPEVSR